MKKMIARIAVSSALLLFSVLFKFPYEWINIAIYVLSYLVIGIDVLMKSIKNIFKGNFLDEHFLMSIASVGAFVISQYPEGICVMLFYQIGELFQDYAVDKSKNSISSLVNLRPEYANLKIGSDFKKVSPDSVNIGDIIIVRVGEKIPLDGIVISGESTVDVSALTGESLPIDVTANDEILSGSINLSGVIEIKVTKIFENSTVSKILELVKNSEEKKSNSEKFITKFAKIYTPIVVVSALSLAFVPNLFLGFSQWNVWLYRALTFLVVSCPCALVLSVPLGFFCTIGCASKKGILIKGSTYIEDLSKTKNVFFDKTGTLTYGKFKIQKINISKADISEQEFLRLVAHTESFSTHPISACLISGYNGTIDKSKVINVNEQKGYGISAITDSKKIDIGNSRLMKKLHINCPEISDGCSVSYVAINNEYAGYITISDTVKEEATAAILRLKNKAKNIFMLTGDNEKVAQYIANYLGIDKYFSNLLPGDKVKIIEKIKEKAGKGKSVFVGDGINDAPALSASDVGIAMGALGSDIAIEVADVVIMNDDITKICDIINLSKKSMRIAKENIFFSILIKLLILIFSAFGIANMWWAVFGDVGVCILAVCNALRCFSYR